MYQQSKLPPALLTKALLRAAEQLELTTELSSLLHIEPEDVAQLQSGARLLHPATPEWSSALEIVGLFRTLVNLLGSAQNARSWLVTPNQTFDGRPLDVLRSADAGRVHRYLQAVQKHELRLPPAARAAGDE